MANNNEILLAFVPIHSIIQQIKTVQFYFKLHGAAPQLPQFFYDSQIFFD